MRSEPILALALSLTAPLVLAQEPTVPATAHANPFGRKYPPRIYNATRLLVKPPVIDGRLDDEAWQKQGEWAGNYTQQNPLEGAPPTEQTELKILYDDKYLYYAIRAYDDPAKIHYYPGRRDDFGEYAVDVVGICFDSYNDKRTGFEFDLTASGGKIDLLLGNGETEWDTTWDAVWDGKVAHDEKGWTAEARIPLNQLRFGKQKEQVWGMHAWRWLTRNMEESQWQLIPRQNTGRLYQLGELHGIRDLPPSRHVELLPHVLGKAGSGPSFPGEGEDLTGSVGLDAKVGLSTNFTLDATVNPDFGQVEADPSVLNLTAYETFYDEKRPFFLEGRQILTFKIKDEDQDQLFYSRRIGGPPSLQLTPGPDQTADAPESTTILGALKVSGKTNDGLSVAALQSFTQKEHAEVTGPSGTSSPVVEPFGSYTAARVQKDWDKGNTILGGMVTSTHRWISDPGLEFLPAQAWSGGLDFVHYFADRFWVFDAKGVASRVEGDQQAILALQTNPVHYYQRPDATHLHVDENATSLSGHGGSLLFGTSGKGRFRATARYNWYSPGLELNDIGYLRQADVKANQVALGWVESKPRGIFREYSFQGTRQDQWDFGGLHTKSATAADLTTTLRNRWGVTGHVAYNQLVDTRALFGGPALRSSDFWVASAKVSSDNARKVSAGLRYEHDWSLEGGTRANDVALNASLRPSGRLTFSGTAEYLRLEDDLQYVGTEETTAGTRWLLGRNNEHLWNITFRINLAITPDLTVTYYGSPFIASSRFTDLRKATDTLSPVYESRFHRFSPAEIAYSSAANAYLVREADGGPLYALANPDFAIRQFRSNLVLRWEYKPGSALYVVWQQGRNGQQPYWNDSFHENWNALWSTPADNVFLVKLSYWFSP
ncbi:MAG TPA: DUF5916 domain-containing protein [Vicinamibacteria bacterium]|nr:DUF5916 domain-containing protein [Vicinamibacteria bacterium]